MSAEIFPGALRVLTGTYAALCQWLTQFAITKALPYIFSSFGYGTWFFFAAWMMVATIWTYFCLPETKGLTIDQMDTLLYVSLSLRHLRITDTIVVAITVMFVKMIQRSMWSLSKEWSRLKEYKMLLPEVDQYLFVETDP